jgi:predicted ester cyclase
MRQALPDLRFRVEDILAEGDQAAARVTRRGTQRGELMGIPATGRSVAWDEIFVARVAGGKIAEGWAVEDKFGLMQQLGAVPAGGHGGHGGHH